MNKDAIARKRVIDGKKQSLYDHINKVSVISTSISYYPNISKLIAYLHDLGKFSDAFQDYIEKGGERGSVIHAWQGAFLANELFTDSDYSALLLKEVIGFCVTSHHNYLNDGVSPDGETGYFDKFLNISDIKYSFNEIKNKITDDDKEELRVLFNNAKTEICKLLDRIKEVYKAKNSMNFSLGLFLKYLFSCLVDADRLDAYLFDIGENYKKKAEDWEALINVFESNIIKFPNNTKIEKIRKTISEKCKTAADRETGIYQLSVPTGGGKTLSSFRFAIHHCKIWHKKRIIYVIPYLSIIEQTAKNLRDILNLQEDSDIIFEHHSNLVEPEDDKSSETRKLSASRWDNPIIITTMVQFLETVMSSKSGKLRKFAAMADSVIIFDEIQSIPIKTVHCFNEIASFLCKILSSTIILCSATQPTLEETQRTNLLLAVNPMLIDCQDDFKDIKRVKVFKESEKDCNTAADFIHEKAVENNNCLVIVNTKKAALEIYNLLKIKAAGFEILHLSTSMYPAHRIKVIENVKRCLDDNKKVICISTQLIEAGVDISFSCVIRAIAGLDSIAQAAGRCNRNGESIEPKIVYIFLLKEENLDKLPDIKSGKETTERISQNAVTDLDFLDKTVMTMFYKQYFYGKESQMDYPTKESETVYAMLSGNNYGKENHINKTGKKFSHYVHHAFHSADLNFSVIDNKTKSVIVLFDESENLIEAYRKQPAGILTKEKILIIKKLQKFSVALYEWQIKKLDEQPALSLLDEETGILLLNESYYSKETGVKLEVIQDDLII